MGLSLEQWAAADANGVKLHRTTTSVSTSAAWTSACRAKRQLGEKPNSLSRLHKR